MSIDGTDVTTLPLLERKRRLLRIMPTIESRMLYLDHIQGRGGDLFRAVCERDVEGIVAKWAKGTYRTDGRATSWLKIKNPEYWQMRDRHELYSGASLNRLAPEHPVRISCFGDGNCAASCAPSTAVHYFSNRPEQVAAGRQGLMCGSQPR